MYLTILYIIHNGDTEGLVGKIGALVNAGKLTNEEAESLFEELEAKGSASEAV